MTDLLVAVGARPNFMKAASVIEAARKHGLTHALVHTGQHYDDALSTVFFRELHLPEPDVYLGVGSAGHAVQTARIMVAFEPELERIDPALVVVLGDVNSTLACSLVAAKKHYSVAHVEAGLRSFDPRMPEEINRKLTDSLSSLLLTSSRDADENLIHEGVAEDRIEFVGNTMIDTLLRFADAARSRGVAREFGVRPGEFALVTLHRPENVDDPRTLAQLLSALEQVSQTLPVVFPVHPRTLAQLGTRPTWNGRGSRVLTCEPRGYLDFVSLLGDAALVLTDSGGVQEESTMLGVPCLTLRDSTERPVTVTEGTNRVVGTSPARIVAAAHESLSAPATPRALPERWDGRAGTRIVARLAAELSPTTVGAHAV